MAAHCRYTRLLFAHLGDHFDAIRIAQALETD
jgi:hypothetical protein